MSASPANLSVWVGDEAVCIRIAGRASVHASLELKSLVPVLLSKGHTRLVLDLTDCVIMDSTFLGVLARQAINTAAPTGPAPHIQIDLLNANARVQELLDTLGVAEYFNFITGQCEHLDQLQAVPQSPAAPDRKALAQTSLEAHETLMALNPDNVPKFKDVAKFLAEEVQRGEATSGQSEEAQGR